MPNRSDSTKVRLKAIDAYLGGKLRLARELSGMSQERLGNHSGLTFQQIQKYEKGTNRMGGSTIVLLANILNIAPGWFFEHMAAGVDLSGKPVPVSNLNEDNLHKRETLELVRAYYQIAERQRRDLYKLIKTMAKQAA